VVKKERRKNCHKNLQEKHWAEPGIFFPAAARQEYSRRGWHYFIGFSRKPENMRVRLYIGAVRLLSILLVFASCGGNKKPVDNASSSPDSVVLPAQGNDNTVVPPPGDSNAMLKDSLYNADSSHRKK